MGEFQAILGVILIISAIIVIALSIYNLVVVGKATTNTSDPQATITDGERKGAIGVNVILIIVGLILGIYGIVLVLPDNKGSAGISESVGESTLRHSRSLTGSVLSASGEYM